jgi:hypothetical protein
MRFDSGSQSMSFTAQAITWISTLSRCSGWSHDQTRTRPEASPDATQKPVGENLAHVTRKLWPR